MSNQEKDGVSFNRFEKLSPGLSRFLSIPADIRQNLIQNARRNWEIDKAYLEAERLTLEQLNKGTKLPSGNTVGVDEKGRRYLIAPKFEPRLKFTQSEWQRE